MNGFELPLCSSSSAAFSLDPCRHPAPWEDDYDRTERTFEVDPPPYEWIAPETTTTTGAPATYSDCIVESVSDEVLQAVFSNGGLVLILIFVLAMWAGTCICCCICRRGRARERDMGQAERARIMGPERLDGNAAVAETIV